MTNAHTYTSLLSLRVSSFKKQLWIPLVTISTDVCTEELFVQQLQAVIQLSYYMLHSRFEHYMTLSTHE